MELFKNFQIGGLFQAGKRMAPPWGAWRRFTNAYKDQTSTLLPYGRGAPASNAPAIPAGSGATGFTDKGPISSQFFRKGILQLHAGFNTPNYAGLFSYLGPNHALVPIMQPFRIDGGSNFVDITNHMTYLPSGNLSSCTVARKAYLNSCVDLTEYTTTKPVNGFTPEESYLMSFDGIRLRGAGLPTPWTFADPSGTPIAMYVRGVYATIGMDGELIMSPYLEERLSSGSVAFYKSGYASYPATPRLDVVGLYAGTVPTRRRQEDSLFEQLKTSSGFGAAGSNLRYFDKRFLSITGSPTVTAGEISVVNNKQSPALKAGDWVMLNLMYNIGTLNADLYMFQIKTLGAGVGNTTVFEKNFKYLDKDTVTWTDADFLVIYNEMQAISVDLWLQLQGVMSGSTFSNLYLIVSYSTTQASGYVVNRITPMEWDSTDTGTISSFNTAFVFTSPWAGVVSSFMTDWYDATVVKTTFPPLKGITNYKELLVGFDKNAIYFSDISLGGSTEMVGGLSNIVPFGSEYGDITSICGSEDFLYVSRERKNYVITGDIAGSSFNITECDMAVQGAYNSKASTNSWAGQVIFVNSSGIFSVSSSGAIQDIGKEIKGLFSHTNRDQNLFDKTVFKTIAETRLAGFDGGNFKFLLEDSRGFVILLTAKSTTAAGLTVTGSNMLVYNTTEGKFYEFESGNCPTAEALFGKIIALGTSRYIEDGVMRLLEKQLLVSQWMTVDAPSLEKQVCQIKMYGEFVATTLDGVKGMTVGQQNNWLAFDTADRTLWETNVSYLPTASDVYIHKKRLDASKSQSTSIILESLATGSFSLEGMEIEGVVVQGSMKK